jgi:hypothetical protein
MWHRTSRAILATACSLWGVGSAVAETWRGIDVAPERRCSHYDASDYPYPQSVEAKIVNDLGGVWGPYTGRTFSNTGETDIEHMVAKSEAHDSGLCSASAATRRQFATDLLNLTLASPTVNRHQKRGRDAAEWLPDENQCWFADRVVRVRQKYGLTIDRTEARALDRVLNSCTSTALIRGGGSGSSSQSYTSPPAPRRSSPSPQHREVGSSALQKYDDNDNGRITCAEARSHGIAPVRSSHPAYRYMNDRDHDGVVCE